MKSVRQYRPNTGNARFCFFDIKVINVCLLPYKQLLTREYKLRMSGERKNLEYDLHGVK